MKKTEMRSSAQKLKNEMAYMEKQKQRISSQSSIEDSRDAECIYRNSCTLENCLSCKRLK